jgi:Na+/serine symporter
MMIAAATVQNPPRGVLLGCLGLGLVGGWMSWEVWRTHPKGDGPFASTLRVLPSITATLPAISVVFLSWAAICVVADVASIGNPRPHSAQSIVVAVIVVLLGLLSLVAFVVGMTLCYWQKPRRFLPPSLR